MEAFDAPMFVKPLREQLVATAWRRPFTLTRRGGCRAWQVVVDLAGDVALQAADDLAFAQSFGGAALDVVAGGLVVPDADDGDDVERAVGGTVTAAAEPVTAGGSSAAGRLWCDTAEFGEGCFAVDAVRRCRRR